MGKNAYKLMPGLLDIPVVPLERLVVEHTHTLEQPPGSAPDQVILLPLVGGLLPERRGAVYFVVACREQLGCLLGGTVDLRGKTLVRKKNPSKPQR